ncbi:MAG: activator of HSP90 ATPase [Dehalococcoidia bacterium]|nr:activator of HSP90 ATPase [Dehalococcoidia bacterium]
MTVKDTIEREVVFKATRSELWAALTTAEGLAGWWCDGAEIDLRPGGRLTLDFGPEHGINHATVVAVEPESRFVTNWRPFQDEPGAEEIPDLTTQIEFRLEDHMHGTLLRVRESGFAALPAALGTKTIGENEYGWDMVLTWLRHYLNTGEKARWA